MSRYDGAAARLPYMRDCTSFRPGRETADLIAMIDGRRQIAPATFARRTCPADRAALYRRLGFDRHCTVKNNHAAGYIAFYRGRLAGRPVVWIEHSRIEFIFGEARR